MKHAVRRYTYYISCDSINLQYLLLLGKVVWFDSFILLFGAGISNHVFELLYHIWILHFVSMNA